MGSPDPPSFGTLSIAKIFRFHAEIVSAVIEWGSYPFPSRTRKSSPRSPMVPGPRIRESRSPLDSRPLDGKPSRGLFFCLSPRIYSGAGLLRTPRRNVFPRRSVTHYRYVPARDCHPGPCAGTGLHDTPLQIRFPSRKRYSLQIQFLLQIRSPLRS